MTAKSYNSYKAVLDYLTTLIDPNQITLVMTDFETSLRNAAENCFPNARTVGWNVHFDRVSVYYGIITAINY